MPNQEEKMGFLGNFMAHNVNISSPDVNAKWVALTRYVKKESEVLSERYMNSKIIQDLISIGNSQHVPDTLFNFSKSLLLLVESENENIKNDPIIYNIAEKMTEVAKLSYDRRVIDIASDIIERLLILKSER
jgi:hypothetical protein